MITLENEFLKAGFLTKGAEWRSLVEKGHGREYLWQADPAFWGKSAPVLFPIVGALKNGVYEYGGTSYALGRHGFARDLEFRVKEQEAWRAVFALDSSPATREVYPFDWTLEVEYRLWKRVLHTTFTVINRTAGPLYFSVGAHPAFRLPFFGEGAFEDGRLDFERAEPLNRWPLNAQGLLDGTTRPVPAQGASVPLSHPLFADDALVLKGLGSGRLSLRQGGSAGGVSLEFPGFPYLGIWSAPGAPFVCLEPWCGVTDSVGSTGRLEDKEGINRLDEGGRFVRSFALTFEG